MAMMAKMRSLAPAFIITVGALFVLFMVISDSNVLEVIGARTNNVGSINGEDISYQDFMRAVEQQRELTRNQTGQDPEEEDFDQLREQVWDALVSQKIFSQEIDRLGITVSDEEIKDAILGPNPPDFLKQNFIDSLGQFNRQLYENALFDPRNKEVLVQAEEYVRQMKLNEKLQSILFASVTVSEEEIRRRFVDNNITLNTEFAFLDVTKISDSLVTVTDQDLKEYYDKNLDRYQIKPQRKVKYVLFKNQPSQDDTAFVTRSLESIKANIKEVESFKENVEVHSSMPYSRDTLEITSFSHEASSALVNGTPGTIIGPVADNQGIALYHLVNVLPGGELTVRASHILINDQGDEQKNLEKANKLYEEIMSGVRFEEVAVEHTNDQTTIPRGGDLGWFTRSIMVKEFEDATFSASVGEVIKPFTTSFGAHVVKVTGRTDKRYVVEKIVIPVKQSATSRDAVFNAANDFSYLAEKNSFEKEAELLGYQIIESPPFAEETSSIPGVGVNQRMVKFAFENGINTVSPPFRTTQGYVVYKVSEVIKEGFRPFDEVKELIRPTVLREKKFEAAAKIANNISSKLNGNLSRASELDQRFTYGQTGTFTANGNVPSVGRDFIYTTKALEADINKITEPFRGMRGYYIIKVVERSPFDETAYQLQRNSIRDNILQEKKSSFFAQWMAQKKKEAKIVDNRHLFFGQ